MERYLKETKMIDYSDESIQSLIENMVLCQDLVQIKMRSSAS